MKIRLQHTERWLTFILLALGGCIPCAAAAKNGTSTTTEAAPARPVYIYHALIPLGSEVFSYSNKQEHQVFYVMVSAQNREFAGDQVWNEGSHRVLKFANGQPVQSYPHVVRFRVSVSDRDSYLLVDPPFPVEEHAGSFVDFITSLKFEMRVFHALKDRVIHPIKVAHIGVPPDVPSNRRVYEVTFDLGDVPISDRVVMHVLTANGDRLAKFNFDLY